MGMSNDIRHMVELTPFVDTHEHLWEESLRLRAAEGPLEQPRKLPAPDFGLLFSHYADSDLQVAGMSGEAFGKLTSYDTPLDEKWAILEPFYARTRHTGYLQNVRESIRMLYGEDDIHRGNYAKISEQLKKQIRPGYYEYVLRDVSKIEYAQVNALDVAVFRETEQPHLLCQDISFVGLSTANNVDAMKELTGLDVGSLHDWHALIDWCFDRYGSRAIALKNQNAYGRNLDYAQVPAEDAAPVFAKYLADKDSVTADERKAFQDHLFHYCLDKAAEYKLPVKLHTGYYAGHGYMPLHRLRHNGGDMCELMMAHKDVNFVIMHITYPFQDEAIAMAKHFPNAYVDMCWAWIINPMASVRFVKEFVMAAPANKLLTFGGDYMYAELVPGHARIARRGLASAIDSLYDEGWVERHDVAPLVERLMRGNAHELFDYESRLAAWDTTKSGVTRG